MKKRFLVLVAMLVLVLNSMWSEKSDLYGMESLSPPSWTIGTWEDTLENTLTFSSNNVVWFIKYYKDTSAPSGLIISDENISASVYKITQTVDDITKTYTFEKTGETTLTLTYNRDDISPVHFMYEKSIPEKSYSATLGEKNAAKSALNYLEYSSFSYDGLVEQLKFEGYTHEEAVYGVDKCRADWNKQAALMAKSYLEYSSFSRAGLIDQLKFEGFTQQQAEYGVKSVGY